MGLRDATGETIRARIRNLNRDYYTMTPPPFYLQSESTEETENLDFAVSFTQEITDFAIGGHHFPDARPGFDSWINIHHYNHGTTQLGTTISCRRSLDVFISRTTTDGSLWG